MTDQPDMNRVVATALRQHAFANRGMLPPMQLAEIGQELVRLLLDPHADLDVPIALMLSRGLSFVSAQAAGMAMIYAALDAADHAQIALIGRRLSVLLADWHKADVESMRHEQEDVRAAVVQALNEQREKSERQRIEAEYNQREQERLAALVTELSAPVIPLYDGILVLPLIGSIDSHRAQDVMENVLESIARSHADSLIIDITGVAVVDTGE
ncbi:MAG: STAS domain-containing protein, partial [Oscillochloris sp.]|nr:STAS domain-containing protein [Oscillochloris sp.]